jgi:hypothetical protein
MNTMDRLTTRLVYPDGPPEVLCTSASARSFPIIILIVAGMLLPGSREPVVKRLKCPA